MCVGADLSDYFNYGFNEDTWKTYCEKQKRMRIGMEVTTVGSITSKITVRDLLTTHTAATSHSKIIIIMNGIDVLKTVTSPGTAGQDRQ